MTTRGHETSEAVQRRRDQQNARKTKQRRLDGLGIRRETLLLRDGEIALVVPAVLVDVLVNSGKLTEAHSGDPVEIARAVQRSLFPSRVTSPSPPARR